MAPLLATRGAASSRGFGLTRILSVSNSFESIATVTVASGGASYVEFTSIPQTYAHLQIRGISRSSRSDFSGNTVLDGRVFLNGDTFANPMNYSLHDLGGNGSNIDLYGNSNVDPYILSSTGQAAPANVFGAFIIDILDYTNTNKYKTMNSVRGNDRNGAGAVSISSSLWRNTNAVTTIRLATYNATTTFVQYSRFALYGIKAAT